MHLRASLLILLGPAALLLAACATEEQEPPTLSRVCRADYEDDCLTRAMAGEGLDLFIAGQGLHPAYEVDLGSTGKAETVGDFRAWIGERELRSPRLSPYSDADEQILVAHLDAGLPLGTYPVRVRTPNGMEAVLPDAFRIADPLRLQLSLDKQSLPLGDTALLTVRFENLGPADLTGIQIEIGQDDPARFSVGVLPEPTRVDGYGSGTQTVTLTAEAEGEGWLSVSASAQAGDALNVGSGPAARIGALVLEPAQLNLSADIQPATLQLDQDLTLRVQIQNVGDLAVHDARLLTPDTAGDGQILWATPNGAAYTIQPGGSQTLSLSGTASGVGTVQVFARIEAREAISGRPLEVQAEQPRSVQIDP